MLHSLLVLVSDSDYAAAAGPDVGFGIVAIRLCAWNRNSIVIPSVSGSMRRDFSPIRFYLHHLSKFRTETYFR